MDLSKDNRVGSIKDLINGGKGLLFKVVETVDDGTELIVPAFAIRYDNQIRAFKNRCGHIAVTLDFQPGEFFSDEGDTLICATHGATYSPDTGNCLGGPCFGIGLEPINITVKEDMLYLIETTLSLVTE